MTTTYEFPAGYTKNGVAAAPSTAPTITVIDNANNILAAGGTVVTALTNIAGMYIYQYSGADGLVVYGLFHTTDATMDQQDVFSKPNINPAVRDIQTRLPASLTANGNMKSSLLEILTTSLTETVGGYLSAAFKKLFDIATPVFTVASVNQTGDSFARLGAPAGASIAADLAEIEVETDGIAAIPINPLLATDVRLNDLDATISSRLSSASYIAPDNVDIATIKSDVENVTYGLNALLTAINTRLAASGYTAPDNADIATILADVTNGTYGLSALEVLIAAIKAITDQFRFTVANQVDANAITEGGLTPKQIWDYLISSSTPAGSIMAYILANLDVPVSSRSTPNSPVTVPPATLVTGSAITVLRGDSLQISINGLGSLANRTKLYFTVKQNGADPDTASIIQIEETAGLIYIMGVSGTAGNGSLTVNDPTAGDITITLAAVESAKLTPFLSCIYDVQIERSIGEPVSTLTKGTFGIDVDATRTTS